MISRVKYGLSKIFGSIGLQKLVCGFDRFSIIRQLSLFYSVAFPIVITIFSMFEWTSGVATSVEIEELDWGGDRKLAKLFGLVNS